jgi:hypothetical protein
MNVVEHGEHQSGLLAWIVRAMIIAAVLTLVGWILAIPLALAFFLFARKRGFEDALERSASLMKAIGALISLSIAFVICS